MSGTLTICGTPIGNLEDITLRVLRILKEVDLIAAEDTRHTIKLLNHFEITTGMTSYHEHNKNEKGPGLISLLKQGKNIALVTDAGMPGISDPGSDLIRLCYQEDIPVTSAPGPTAFVTALVLSGLYTGSFIFEGFLPQDKGKRRKIIENIKNETRTVVFYEAPHHLLATLQQLFEILGEREVVAARELTKKFEECKKGTIQELLAYYTENNPKGEYVLVIAGADILALNEEEKAKWEEISMEEHVKLYLDEGRSEKEAMKLVALDRKISKRDVYREIKV